MQDVIGNADASTAASKARDNELAKIMFEGGHQYRKKLRLPDMSPAAAKLRDAVRRPPLERTSILSFASNELRHRLSAPQAQEASFFDFYENDCVGRYFFERFVAEVHPVHGNMLLLCGRYRTTVHKKRQVAQQLCDEFVNAISEIYSGEDPHVLVEAYAAGRKVVAKPGKKSKRQMHKTSKVEEAKGIVHDVVNKMSRGLPPDLVQDMHSQLQDELEVFWRAFKRSQWIDLYARHKSLENEHVHDEDFHQFRVLGVGGFGSVNAAIKKVHWRRAHCFLALVNAEAFAKSNLVWLSASNVISQDTGLLVAIKRMDKKLIKHKNRYKVWLRSRTVLTSASVLRH